MLRAALGSRVPVAAVHAQTDEEGKPVMALSCNIASADGSYEALSVPNPNPNPNPNPILTRTPTPTLSLTLRGAERRGAVPHHAERLRLLRHRALLRAGSPLRAEEPADPYPNPNPPRHCELKSLLTLTLTLTPLATAS
jgi:hypothetical protein